jgi:hypothetical protein
MAQTRKVEVFSAGCALCHEVIDAVRREAGSSCEVIERNMMDSRGLRSRREIGHSNRSSGRNRRQAGVLQYSPRRNSGAKGRWIGKGPIRRRSRSARSPRRQRQD